MVLDHLPADFARPLPDHQSREKAVRNTVARESELARREQQQIRKRRRRLEREVEKELAHEPKEVRDGIFRQKFNLYLEKKMNKGHGNQGPYRGPLPVVNPHGTDGGDNFDGEEVDLNASKVPALSAVQTVQSIVCYMVYMTEPLDQSINYEDALQRTKSFGRLDSANKYARSILEASWAPSRRYKDKSRTVQSQNIAHLEGLIFGSLKLSDGKTIYVMVRKETILSGNLDPDALRNRWIDEAVLDVYRPRYDVYLHKVVPRSWQYLEDKDRREYAKREKRRKNDAGRNKTSQSQRQSENNAEDGQAAEESEPCGLEGSSLREALNALPMRNSGDQHDPDIIQNRDDLDKAHREDGASSEILDEANDDEVSSQVSHSTMQNYGPHSTRPSDSYSSLTHDVDYAHITGGSYTDLRLANLAAFSLAEAMWKPRIPDITAVTIYRDEVLPQLQQEKDDMDLDNEKMSFSFPVHEFTDGRARVDHRPWGFTESVIMVEESKLEGPRDFEVDFEVDLSDCPYRRTTLDEAAGSAPSAGARDVEEADLESGDESASGHPGIIDDGQSDHSEED